MYYLTNGIRFKAAGKILGILFAIFAAVAAFGIGNMTQSNSVADALREAWNIPMWVTGIVIAVAVAAVILGGIKSIGRLTGVLVPFMIIVYMLASSIVLLFNLGAIPSALALVFKSAFTGTAATGGFVGATIALAIRNGVERGIFSNESGLGSAGIAAAAAQTREPVRQAMVSMTQTFIDTIIVCSLTGLAIIATGVWDSGLNGAPLTQSAFNAVFTGGWGAKIVSICLSLFAFSTILGWSYYGEKSVEYLAGVRAILPYRLLFVGAAFFGTIRSLDFVWGLSAVVNGLMALPNLVGLLLLTGIIVKETNDFFTRQRE